MTAFSAFYLIAFFISSLFYPALTKAPPGISKTCTIRPLGPGKDDTAQVEAAISTCGHFGTTVFEPGNFNITRKMTWDLVSSKVDLKGFLNFHPDIQFWLNANNTYRVVFIQSQASWFVVTGSDFVIDAHNTGGIQGNGQTWWSFFATRTKQDGDGRPISLTLWKVQRGIVRNFQILSPPFWSNTAAESSGVVYDGMFVNATNEDPLFVGKNIVPNTDGINTYRSDNITMLNWDITCGDDCLAIKGNSSNIFARNITCRGGNGIAFGSLGQYANMSDSVLNVDLQDLRMIRLDPNVQPNMANGVYFKSWDGSVNGAPPTGGGGGPGNVSNISATNVQLDRVNAPIHLYQTNGGHSADLPSVLTFGKLRFSNWTGTAVTNKIVDIECSPAVGCKDISFSNFDVVGPVGQAPRFICQNVSGLSGLSVGCNATGQA